MFSDETRVKCRACGKYVMSEDVPSCVRWCTSARECLGEERWRALMGEATDEREEDEQEGDADG
jgi:hypothetical protein